MHLPAVIFSRIVMIADASHYGIADGEIPRSIRETASLHLHGAHPVLDSDALPHHRIRRRHARRAYPRVMYHRPAYSAAGVIARGASLTQWSETRISEVTFRIQLGD